MKNNNVMIFTDIRIKKFLGVKMQLAFYDCAINGPPLFFKLREKNPGTRECALPTRMDEMVIKRAI